MLSDNLIDIAFVFTLPKSNKFICENILEDEIILVAKNSKEFKDKVFMKELKSLSLLYANSGDILIKSAEDKINYKLEFRFSIDQVFEILKYLCDGFGY